MERTKSAVGRWSPPLAENTTHMASGAVRGMVAMMAASARERSCTIATRTMTRTDSATGTSRSAMHGLLHVLDLTAIGLVLADEERLEGGREFLLVEVALLVGLHLGRVFPQADREPRIRIGGVLQEPPSTQALARAPLGGHRRLVRSLYLVS